MLPITRAFLGAVPNLGTLMDQVVIDSGVNVNNFEELRGARETARETVLTRLKEEHGLHTLIHFPELQENSPITGALIKGGYVELNNAGSGKSVMIPMVVWYHFIEQGELKYVENVVNVGNSKVSERPMPVDLQALLQVMARSALPEEVQGELQAFIRAQQGGAA